MPKVKIITHDGNFHPDELFAVATLLLVLDLSNDEYEIIRTRDPEAIKTGDYILDVGGIYDPANNRFDHHQIGRAGERPNGIPYATFGLVWKKFGEKICGGKEIADRVDEKMVQSIDADDNGVATFQPLSKDITPYQFESAISSFIPTWREKDQNIDAAFLKVLVLVEEVLAREITRAKHYFEGKSLILEAYEKAEDKRIIILKDAYSWKEVLSKFPEPLFVVGNDGRRSEWAVASVREEGASFVSRKLLPESWAGKRDDQLAKITGVKEAFFCHNGRHLAMAKTFDGAMAMAKLALES